jgi:hypothetical protein
MKGLAIFNPSSPRSRVSRRLSKATPPEPHANQNASQRDASMQRERCRTLGPLAGIPSGCGSSGAYSGGVAALNHRLIAGMPPASDSSPSMIWDTRGFHNRRHSGAVLIRVSSPPRDTIFFYPTRTAKSQEKRPTRIHTHARTSQAPPYSVARIAFNVPLGRIAAAAFAASGR